MRRLVLIAVLIFNSLSFPSSGYSYAIDTEPYSIRSPEDLVKWLHGEFTYEFKFPDNRQSPEETARLRKGDCEDFAFLCQSILGSLGIKSDVIVIKFRQIGILHAICVFKQGATYSFMSNRDIIRTRGRTVAEAVNEKFPDWERIAYMTVEGSYSDMEDRGYAIGLAASNLSMASLFGGLMGAEYKDIGMIKLVLQEQLTALATARMPVNSGTFMTILKEKTFGYSSQHSIKFLFDRLELTPGGFLVACRAEDADGPRYYYAIFTINRNADNGFSVAVYTEDEWQRTGGFDMPEPRGNAQSSPAGFRTPEAGTAERAFPVLEVNPM